MSIFFFSSVSTSGIFLFIFFPLLTYELFIPLFCLKDTSGGTARHLRAGPEKAVLQRQHESFICSRSARPSGTDTRAVCHLTLRQSLLARSLARSSACASIVCGCSCSASEVSQSVSAPNVIFQEFSQNPIGRRRIA